MKPSWKDAPEWATCLAQDFNGTWIFFEFEPYIQKGLNYWVSNGREYCVLNDWKETLERRPE